MEPLLERELAAVERLLAGDGGVLVVEGGAGIGKTSLLDVACVRGAELCHEVLRARGADLEAGFANGVVLQLLERRVAELSPRERDAVLRRPAAAARPLLLGGPGEAMAGDASFAVRHGLYWVAANLAADRPLLVGVDDLRWADPPSLRWLAYLAARLEGLDLALIVTLRPGEPATADPGLLAVLAEARAVQRPALLSEPAVGAIVRRAMASGASDELCTAVHAASGGNPLYAHELLRAADQGEGLAPAAVLARGRERPLAPGTVVA